MGITIIQETPEEAILRKREAAKRRIRVLAIICFCAIGARLVIKDPKPIKAPDHTNAPVRYLPGMLDSMSEEARRNLTPTQLTKFQEADFNALEGSYAFNDAWVRSPYTPQEIPDEITEDIEAYKEQVFKYAKKQRKIEAERKKIIEADIRKKTLVLFKKGGYLKVKEAEKEKRNTNIYFDETTLVQVPSRIVKSVSENALTWKLPVPKGYVSIKPARGITLVVSKRTSKRIRKRKKRWNET